MENIIKGQSVARLDAPKVVFEQVSLDLGVHSIVVAGNVPVEGDVLAVFVGALVVPLGRLIVGEEVEVAVAVAEFLL